MVENGEKVDLAATACGSFSSSPSPYKAPEKEPWFKRSSTTYDLRATDARAVVLMRRIADENGLDPDGAPALWHDVATFKDFGEARILFARLVPISREVQ